jgi:hypothetical protein
MLSANEERRLSAIRKGLEHHRAKGVDVSAWEAEFLLRIIAREIPTEDETDKEQGVVCQFCEQNFWPHLDYDAIRFWERADRVLQYTNVDKLEMQSKRVQALRYAIVEEMRQLARDIYETD